MFRTLWLFVMAALVTVVTYGFVLTLRYPASVDIPGFSRLFAYLGVNLRSLIVIFQVVPSALALGAAVWMFLAGRKRWFALLLGPGLFSLYAYASGSILMLEAKPGWGRTADYIETAALALVLLGTYLFPNGKFEPGWSRWTALWSIGTLFAFPWIAGAIRRAIIAPYQVPGDQLAPAIVVGAAAFILLAIAQVVRYRMYANTVEQQQARWMLVAIGLFIFSAMGAGIAILVAGRRNVAVGILVTLTAVAGYLVPAAALVAVRRYRLFELERVVSRAVSFSIVVGLVGLVYVGGVFAVHSFLPAAGDLAVAASTLAAAAAFAPLRRAVNERVERRFNRARFNSEVEMTAFSDRVANEVSLEALSRDLFDVVSHTVQPCYSELWIRGAETPPAESQAILSTTPRT